MKRIILVLLIASAGLSANAQSWSAFNAFGVQRKIASLDTSFRILPSGVNQQPLELQSRWKTKQALDGKANKDGGNTLTGPQVIDGSDIVINQGVLTVINSTSPKINLSTGGDNRFATMQILSDTVSFNSSNNISKYFFDKPISVNSNTPLLSLNNTLTNTGFSLGNDESISTSFTIKNKSGKTLVTLTNANGTSANPQLSIGTNSAIPQESQLYVYGGNNGANIDARGRPERDETNMDFEGSDWSTNPNSLGFSYFGPEYNLSANPSMLGYEPKKLGQIRFNEINHALITSNNTSKVVPIRFGINNTEIADISDKGLSYYSDFSTLNASNPRWLVDKAYVDGVSNNKANTDASNINVENYKTTLGLPSTGGYDLQSIMDRGNIWQSQSAYGIMDLRGSNTVGGNAIRFRGMAVPYAEIAGEYFENNIGALYLRTFNNGVISNRVTVEGVNGNVGIGTTSPTEKLHVVGKATVTEAPTNPNDVVRLQDLAVYAASLVTTNMTATPLSKAMLNSAYPTAPVRFEVVCPNIGFSYKKYMDTGEWYSTAITILP